MNKDRKQRIYDEGRRDGFYAGVRAERTLSASQIVRCRDCRFLGYDRTKYFVHKCRHHDLSFDEPDGFCAWGERRDDA